MSSHRHLLPCLGVALALLASASAGAAAPPVVESSDRPAVLDDVGPGKPLVVLVVVPLCSNQQIACGEHGLGNAGNLRTNLYWGALFGARRFFDRPALGYERLATDAPTDPSTPWLERVVYRRWVDSAPQERGGVGRVEQLVVLEAFHGDRIDAAVDHFFALAGRGGSVTFRDGAAERTERIDVVGYAGHDRLMDGHRPPAPPAASAARPIPSFVLACLSERFFGPPLRAAGSRTLVMTTSFVAPEGYAIEAAVRALGDGAQPEAIREAGVAAYAQWQSIPLRQSSRYFAR